MGRKDTTPNVAAASAAPFTERKHKPDGTTRSYETELLYRDGRVVVVRFRMLLGGGPPTIPVPVPPGSVSLGYFWARRPYNLYRMLTADGQVIAHRFDAVTDVRFDDSGLDYRDLILDWWVLPDDTLIEEDRDEFEAARDAGELKPADEAKALEAARQVYSRYRHIIDEAVELQRRIGDVDGVG